MKLYKLYTNSPFSSLSTFNFSKWKWSEPHSPDTVVLQLPMCQCSPLRGGSLVRPCDSLNFIPNSFLQYVTFPALSILSDLHTHKPHSICRSLKNYVMKIYSRIKLPSERNILRFTSQYPGEDSWLVWVLSYEHQARFPDWTAFLGSVKIKYRAETSQTGCHSMYAFFCTNIM